jgi:uncharacterized membrane protein
MEVAGSDMSRTPETNPSAAPAASHPFRGAVLRGLGLVLPPLLTIVIFFWIGGTVEQYVLGPVTTGTERALAWWIADIREADDFPAAERGKLNPTLHGIEYRRLPRGSYVPKNVYDEVIRNSGENPDPKTVASVYRSYVRIKWLRPYFLVPLFLCLFILLLYLLGKFMAAGIGRFFWSLFEGGIRRVPLVRNVYSSVKQVSGFLLNERHVQISRIVVVEYPRRGVWALGFLINQGMQEIETLTGDECVTVLVCTSPMPMAGFTITVRRSEVLELNITLDQAIQFIVSCGVVLPRPVANGEIHMTKEDRPNPVAQD